MLKNKGVRMDNLQVSHFMAGKSLFFTKDMPVANAVDKLLTHKYLGGPVIDGSGKVIGWLSEQDCLSRVLNASYHCELIALVEDIMSTPAVTIKADCSIVDLAQLMLKTKPKIYPVVDDDNVFIGLITRKEVLKGISKQLESC